MTAAARWRAAGLDALTGRSDGPGMVPTDGVIEAMEAIGAPIGVDVLPLLGERAPLLGLARGGSVSCGGATWLLPAADGWVALSLARESDVELLPAFLGVTDPGEVPDVVAAVRAEELRAVAILLGLPFAVLGERAAGVDPVEAVLVGESPPLDRPPVVVDLSSLWAGPLCSRLLLRRGAQVLKVESTSRPDGARATPGFFAAMHEGKEQRSVDVGEFADLVAGADVVIEGSRPRALEQLGIVAADLLAAADGPRVWVSITGHGRAAGERVAFGDDAAVAGGLVVHDDDGPCFVADAVADPLTGIAAAAATTAALAAGGRWLVDASLAGVAAWVAAGEPTG